MLSQHRELTQLLARCRGIDVVRNKIKMFAQKKVTLPPGRHKIVILDEADRWAGFLFLMFSCAWCFPGSEWKKVTRHGSCQIVAWIKLTRRGFPGSRGTASCRSPS